MDVGAQVERKADKMYYADAQLAKIMMSMRLEEAQSGNDFWERRIQIFLERPSWLGSQVSKKLRQLGHGLVTLGRRLEQRNAL